MVTYSTPQTIDCKKGDHLLSEGDHLLQSRLSPGIIYFRGPFTLWQIYTHLLQEYSPWQLPGSPSSLQISLAPKISGDSLKIIYTRSTLYAYPYNMLCKRLIQIQLKFLTQKVYFLNFCEYLPLWTLNVGRVSWPPSRSQWSPAAGGGRGIPLPLYSASLSPSDHAGGLDSMLHSNCYGNETVIWVKGQL